MTRLLVAVFILLALAVMVVAGASYWVFATVNKPHAHTRSADYIKIERGTAPREIIARLVDEGIIVNPTATNVYLRFFGDASKLQAGEYQFPSPITPLEVLRQLEKGQDRTFKLTIPEGFTRFDIAKRMLKELPGGSHVTPIDEASLLAMMDDTTLIRDISPEAKNLEGYMYPSTYDVPIGMPPEKISKVLIESMVAQFRKVWKPEWTAQARAIGRTPHEIVTIASLIETETGVENERTIVAGIINNRLKKNIPLGIDQTNVYIAKMMGRWDGTIHKSDLEVNSPYNTRKRPGLPPGPISSVSESSIKAALNPDQNNFLFYVRNVDLNDGSHWFYASAAEFEKGKAKYQQWLEKERDEKRTNAATSPK
jgi:UPF0755 protein